MIQQVDRTDTWRGDRYRRDPRLYRCWLYLRQWSKRALAHEWQGVRYVEVNRVDL